MARKTILIHEHSSTGNKDDYWAYWSVTVSSINSKIQNSGIPTYARIDRVGLIVNSDYDGGLGTNPYKAYLQFGFSNATNSISDYVLNDTRITKEPTNYPSGDGADVTNRFDKANLKFNSSVGTYFVMCVHTESPLISAQKAQYAYVVVDYTEHTHSYTSTITKQPTCTATGVRTYTCSCGNSYTETIAKDSSKHTGSQQILSAVAATCTTAGKTEGKKWSCCNAIITAQQTIPALGHDWNYTTYQLSDDGKTMTAQRVCKTDANHKETETVPTTSEITKEPTCADDGWTKYYYTFSVPWAISGNLSVPNIPAKGHTWVNATCTSPKKCSVCGTTEGNALPHSYTSTVIPPTASADGYTSHTCSGCGHNYKDNYRINKIFFGTTQPSKIFFGTQEVKEVYYGTTKVYGPK